MSEAIIAKKAQLVTEVAEQFKNASSVVVVDYLGITVEEATNLRAELRNAGVCTMIHIRPVSDLRNKFPEIEEIVLNDNVPVFLTKNGHGSMVVLSVEQYTTLMESVEKELDVADRIAETDETRYTHSEVFDQIRGKINGK